MNKTIIAGLMLASLLGAQERPAQGSDSREATLSDVVKALERIEEQIAQERRVFRGEKNEEVDFGGAPIYPFRILLGRQAFQSYYDEGGSYEAVPLVLFPFANGGGGTWRFTFNERLSIGLNLYGYGFSSLGFLKHDTAADGPNVTIDKNSDGWDDYYSYAGYGITVFSFLVSLRQPIGGAPVGVFGGVQIGVGSESIGFSRYGRTSNVLTNTLGIQIADLDWSRAVLATGFWVGLDAGSRRVKIALEGGLDYYVPIGGWMPASGMHRKDVKPEEGINGYSVWFSVGPHFNY